MQRIEVRYWCKYGNGKNENKLVEWKALVDTVGIKSTDLKDKFLFYRVLRLSELLRCRGRPQTAICFLEWLGRFKCLTTGLDARCHFFLICEDFLGIGHLDVFLFHQCTTFFFLVISDLDGSLGSRHFFYVMNERTSSFASWASAFESSRLVFGLKWTEMNQRVADVFVAFKWNKWRMRKDSTSLWIILWNLKFLRMIDLTAWLWVWNVRVNGIRPVFSMCAFCSADGWSICWRRRWLAWTTDIG